MRITIIAVGKLRDQAVAELVSRYGKRLPRSVKVEWIEVPAVKGGGDSVQAMDEEAKRIGARIPERAAVAALTESGDKMDSMALAKWIGRVRDSGRDVCFIIGGADGLAPQHIIKADLAISLSPLTFPHELVRAILAEQVYRAFSILQGEPYHRG